MSFTLVNGALCHVCSVLSPPSIIAFRAHKKSPKFLVKSGFLPKISFMRLKYVCYQLFRYLLSSETICFSVSKAITLSAILSASCLLQREISLLVDSNEVGFTLYSSRPKDIRSGIKSGSAAASPHIPTGMPAFFPSEIMCRSIRKTAGENAE